MNKWHRMSIFLLWPLSLLLIGRITWEYTRNGDTGENTATTAIVRPDSTSHNALYAPPRYHYAQKSHIESFPFDPNEADSVQLLRLGLTPAQVRSIYRHRAKGYAYSSKEDFSHTPFMTRGQWEHLEPLIVIGEKYQLLHPDTYNKNEDSTARITDTTRHAIHQRRSPIAWRININTASFKQLVAHPYLSYDQVKALKNLQRKYGDIKNMSELLILPEFTPEDTLRLAPIADFH